MSLKPKIEISPNYDRIFSENKTVNSGRDSIIIKGVIWDSTHNEPMNNHSIFLKNLEVGTQTNSEGYFELKINKKQIAAKLILVTVNPYLGKK